MKALKWLGIVVGTLFALVLAAAVIVPLVVDVDKYRPRIVEAANQKLNGKLEIGKLSLSLWGQIRVQVDGLSIKDGAGKPVMAVKDAYFHLPFLSLLSGSPEMVFKMDRPSVNVIKHKNGKLNAMALVKESPASGSAQAGAPAAATGSAPTEIPAIAAQARIGIEMKDAQVEYVDEATALKSEIKDLNLVIKDISLTRTMDLQLWADIDTSMAKGTANSMIVKGPARMSAQVKPELVGGAFDHATIQAKVDLDGLDIAQGAVFHKAAGVAAHAELKAVGSAKEVKVERFAIRFFNAEITATARLTGMGAAPAAPGGAPPAPHVTLSVESNEIELKPWNQLVPMLSDFDLAGSAKLSAEAQGPADKLGYKANFEMKGFTAKAPSLKTQPRVDLAVEVVTNELKSFLLTMKAPGNDLVVKGKLANFARPVGGFDVTSSGMDLDQMVNWPPPAAKFATTAAAPGGSGAAPAAGGGKAAAAVDLDASLDGLRANPAAGMSLTMNVHLKMVKAQGIRMDDLVGKAYFRDLVAGVESFGLKLWGGTVKASFAAQLKPKQPTYTFGFALGGLNLQKAVEANVQAVKNTLLGKLSFEINGAGASFNPEPAQANLKAKGSFKVVDASFATVDVTKMATEGVNKALAKVAEKVPQAKGKGINSVAGKESKYEWIASSFAIDGGKFKMPDFATKAAPGQGIDLKGYTEVGLKDYALATRWEVIDTFDLTGGCKISVDVSGTRVDHLLCEGSGPLKFSVSAGCTCFAPCYSYTEAPEQLARVAAGNVAGAAAGRAKAELQKKVESVVPKSAPPAVQNAVQGIGKKLFGR